MQNYSPDFVGNTMSLDSDCKKVLHDKFCRELLVETWHFRFTKDKVLR
jgi:hypothetical protein